MTASEADAFVRKLRGKAYITGFSWGFFSDWVGAVCGLVTNNIEKLQTHADRYTADGGKFMAELRLSGSLESMASVAEIKPQLQQTPKGNFWFF